MKRRNFIKSLGVCLIASGLPASLSFKKKLNLDNLEYDYKYASDWINNKLNTNLWSKQREIANLLQNNKKISVALGHGLGGTYILAASALWFLYNYSPSRVFTIAPTVRQLRRNLWTEISKLNDNYKKLELFCGHSKLIKDFDSYVMVIGKGDYKHLNENYKGHTLFVLDEANEINKKLIKDLSKHFDNNYTKVIMMGKPTVTGTYFHKTHVNKNLGFKTMNISAFESPNIWKVITKDNWFTYKDIEPLPYPSLVNLKWIKEVIIKYDAKSSFVRGRVDGKFPS